MRHALVPATLLCALLTAGCSKEAPPDDETPPTSPGRSGGGSGRGGATGTGGSPAGNGGSTGTGGSSATGGSGAGAGGALGGASGGAGGAGGGAGGSGSGGAGGSSDAGPSTDVPTPTPDASAPGDGGTIPPPAAGQGPPALGRIVYSNDFEKDMAGISRSPNGLPMDRAVIDDDPLGQRGKVMKVTWRAGDNFRTSGGTEPRSWISNRPGHEFRPGTKVSHAFGFMMDSADSQYCFGQIISSGGPVWMLIVEGNGLLTVFCNTCGGNTRHMNLEPKKWYDFRVDMDFSVGGMVAMYINGQMFRMGRVTSTRGDIAHWDGGIYNRAAGTAANKTRTVYISNLSVGVRD